MINENIQLRWTSWIAAQTTHCPAPQYFYLGLCSWKRTKRAPGLHVFFSFSAEKYNFMIVTMNKTLCCCVQSGKLARFTTWQQSSERYLKSWIWAKNNYNNTVCTAVVRVCQHFSVKSVDQILMASLKSWMLLSSTKCSPWILTSPTDKKLRNYFQIWTFMVTHSELQVRDFFWSLLKSRVHLSLATHHSHWKKYDF